MATKMYSRRTALKLMAMSTSLLFFSSRVALADTQGDLDAAQKQLDEVQKQLDDISSQYEALAAEQDKTKKQIEDVQTQIDDTQHQIDQKQQQLTTKKRVLGARVSSAYKSGANSFLSVLLSSTSLAELSSNIYYLDKISAADRAMIDEVNRIKAELDAKKSQLEDTKSSLEKLKSEQDEELSRMQEKQDESRKVIEGLSADVKNLMAQRDAELEAAARERELQASAARAAQSGKVSYTRGEVSGSLNLGGGLSGSQQKVLRMAYSIGSPGVGLCAMWVSQVFSAAGYGYPSGNANDMYNAWCTSSNKSTLKPGMVIAVPTHPQTRAGRIYGHIGIYVGNGIVRQNIGRISEQSLDSWISFYGKTATPRWGWCMGIPLS